MKLGEGGAVAFGSVGRVAGDAAEGGEECFAIVDGGFFNLGVSRVALVGGEFFAGDGG